MTQEPTRPWLEIPAPSYPPPCDHEKTRQPHVGGDQKTDDLPGEEKRVIILDIQEINMRVFVPDKKQTVISEVLKDLYMLKKAIDYESGTAESRSGMVDNIRDKLRDLLEESKQD